MEKRIKISLISDTKSDIYTLNANLTNNILKYKENDNNVTFDLNQNLLIRENDSMYLQFSFKKNKNTTNYILMKELANKVYITINTTTLEKDDQHIKITYKILE